MPNDELHVIGREPELETIASFVADRRDGPAALLIEGDAGIGKTTLWQAGVDAAARLGYRVLSTRIGESETKLAFTALGDLLDPVVDEVGSELPDPQRSALRVALLRAEASGPDLEQRAISLGTLGVVRALARSYPVILALDDLQWLDGSSARVLAFVLRRLRDEPVGVLASVRLGVSRGGRLALDRALPAHRVHRVFVGPMPPEALGHLIRRRTGTDIARPILQRIERLSQGNPFFALEIAEELSRRGIPAAGASLPVPDDLRSLLRVRLESLPSATSRLLLVVSAAARPTQSLVRAASDPRSGSDASALVRAEGAGVIRIDGDRIDFTHPLLASTIYEGASSAERRAVHRRLAEAVDDPEERARHLALASRGPDRAVAAALDLAASQARGRGAPDAAAELSELARRETPVTDAGSLRERTVQAAQHHFDAGDVARSTALFDEAIDATPPGRERARILFLSGSHAWMDLRRVGELCERALVEAEGDPEVLAEAHEHLAWVAIYRGDLAAASRHSAASLRQSEAISSPAKQAEALATSGMVRFLTGRATKDVMSRAAGLAHRSTRDGVEGEATVYTSANTNHGLQLLWAGDLDTARRLLEAELGSYEKEGRYLVRDEVLGYLSELECRAGNWDVAARHAKEAYEIDVESGRVSGLGHTLFSKSLLEAHRGELDAATLDAEQGLRISIGNDDPFYASCNRSVLGFIELSRSDPAGAMEHLGPVVEFLGAMDSAEPGVIPCLPDAIECLVALGDLGAAERLVAEQEEKGRRLDRPWALATAARGRALIAAHGGDPIGALQIVGEAIELHGRVPRPFELGRTLLVQGEIARRAKRKAPARASLERARAIFDGLGSPMWSARAEAELVRTGGPAAGAELTPTERRIADLVVEGRTNREIADALFISIKTVEANLSRIFHKRSVRSRAHLIGSLLGSEPARAPGDHGTGT